MKLLARRSIAVLVTAAILAAQWPASAWAAAAPVAEPNPVEAMTYLRSLGVYKDDADPLKTYLGSNDKLTPIGRTLYLSLKARYNPAEEVESLQPVFERLRGNGAYTEARQDGAARAMKIFERQFGELAAAPAGSVEESFHTGALREALMTGAAVADSPQGSAYAQVPIKDGYEFWDKDGLAFRMFKSTASQVTTYNRELKKNQKLMNLSRPPQVNFVPETGRYNYEMLQETEYAKATRTDRMIAIAELLGEQHTLDSWFNDETLEPDLLRKAKAKTYTDSDGESHSVFDIVEAKLTQRRAYLEGAHAAVLRYETDMNRFKGASTITDSQVATMSLDEQNALRWLSLSVLEIQMFYVKNQRERVDPTAPDAQAIMKTVDESDLTQEQKVDYKEQGRAMKDRLDELRRILDLTRKALNKADYAGSLDAVQAALSSTQKELGELSVDYSIYLEAPSTAFLAKEQTLSSFRWYNPHMLDNGARWVCNLTPWGDQYAENMKAIEGDGKTPAMAKELTGISALIASGGRENWLEARRRVVAMNPQAAAYAMSGSAGGEASKVNDALRISSSLKANHEHINAVTEINKTLDAASSFLTWTVSIALLAPVTRASLNLVGKVSGVGAEWINTGRAMSGVPGKFVKGWSLRVAGRSAMLLGETAKHTAARLESLEPSPARVRAAAGENAAAQYAVASGVRALSVATRQATFTGLSGAISGGFTVGTHLWDIGANRIGGVNIGGWQAIEPGHTMFSEDLAGLGKAAKMGFLGGAWWANESFHPALGYIGLPSTIFGGTRLAGTMETIGTRGVVGSASRGGRVLWNSLLAAKTELKTLGIRGAVGSPLQVLGRSLKIGGAVVEAAETAAATAGRTGFLQRWSEEKVFTGKPLAAFGLSMADNVWKYTLFSSAASWVGRNYSWWTSGPVAVPFVGVVNHPEQDLERRIKFQNQTGQAWLASPAWLLIPTYGAHSIRDAGPYMMTREGMKQYDATGRTKEYANAPEGKVLKMTPVKPPVSQLLFESRVWGEAPPAEWIVTKQAKEAGQLKEVRRLAGEGGLVNPIELMAVRDMVAGQDTFRTLHVTEEVQEFAYEVATEGLVAQTENSLQALSIKPGESVKGWGEITPDIQIDIAKALYRAEVNLGRKLTPELHGKVREVLKDHLLANLPIGEAGKVLRAAVVGLAADHPHLDQAQKEAIETVLSWEEALSRRGGLAAKEKAGGLSAKEAKTFALSKLSYLELTQSLRQNAEARLKAGELSAKEGKALTALYDYIIAGDARFNSFNRPEVVKARADVIFDSLLIKFKGRSEMLRLVEGYREKVNTWAEGQVRKGLPADGASIPEAEKATKLETFIGRLEEELKAKLETSPVEIGPSERAALEKALGSIKTSAWVVRDAKGGAIPGWRAKQYVRLMQAFLGEGRRSQSVKSVTEERLEGMRAEHKASPGMLRALDGIELDLNAWVKSREAAPGDQEPVMSALVERLDKDLKTFSKGLAPEETEALQDVVSSISNLDREGLHKGILSSGRNGKNVRLFVKAPTSLGKTLLAYEGLLPYLEAEAAASKRKVMFLTFNTKLQAQAEFDFLAFNKLGSEVKFETYEGLKTMIAEGKTKGRNVAEDYLMLQDEMDAAGQQPALTIGMVSGRVSRLSGQTTALNDSNAGLAWGMRGLNTARVEAAEVQAQRIKAVTEGISDAHVERGRLGAIRTAAEDVLETVGQLKRAKGAVEVDLAEAAGEKARENLLELIDSDLGLPRSESEAANTIHAALERMKEALALRPTADQAVRERLAVEQESAFLSQNRLMNLTDTVAGLERLPAEAQKARWALESKIENLQKDLAQAEAKANNPEARTALESKIAGLEKDLSAAGPEARPALETKIKNLRNNLTGTKASDAATARRAMLLREQIERARVEKTMVERFDGVDASTRLLSLDEQIAAIRVGEARSERLTVNPKSSRLARQSAEVDAQIEPLGAADPGALKSYRTETRRAMKLERSIAETEGLIKAADKRNEPTEAFTERLTELNADSVTSQKALRKLEASLGGEETAPKLARLMRQSLALEARIEEAASSPNAAAKSTPKLDALVSEARALEADMAPERRAMHQEYRTLLDRVRTLSSDMGEADAASRASLESQRATVRGRLRAIELDLSAAPAEGDLGGMLRRIRMLSSEKGSQARKEETALRRQARTEIIKRFDEAGAHIVKLTREGAPGWDARVNRLLERRRALQEAYAGDESALYVAYREMKESARPLGEDPRLTRKPYEIAGDDGSMEPAMVLKRADFFIDRARQVEAKPKGGGIGPIEAELMIAREKLKSLADKPESRKEYNAAVDPLRQLEVRLLDVDAFHASDLVNKRIAGDSFLGFLPSLPKFLFQAAAGTLPSAATESMGLTRYHAAKMLEALFKDPMLPSHQRDNLMWSYLNSLLFPNGLAGRGSYVRSEIVNMVQGFHDNPAGVRMDNRADRFNVVHNGQWFESMDNAPRRYWELEYGTDLTLPYTHNSMSTIKDVTTNKRSYFISLSGTSGVQFEAHLRANEISLVGEGSAMPKNVRLEMIGTPEQRLEAVVASAPKLSAASRDYVALRGSDDIPAEGKMEIEKSIKAYMADHGMKPGEPQVFEISKVDSPAARLWLQGIRATQRNTVLTVLSVSDTRALKAVEKRLKKSGIKQDEIAKVFADTEYLRQNVPEANVLRQMNIEGLNTGKVKVLILDTRVGGRGLDLNFKGERNSTRPGAFRGYTNFEMLVLGPEEMSGVHMVQAMGRIDTGRTLNQAPRRFKLLMDIETAKGEAVFRDMFETNEFFVEMRKDPSFQEYARTRGGRIDWSAVNDYVLARRDGEETPGEGALLYQRYEKAVRKNLADRNLEVEENLLRQSQVLNDRPTTQGKNPALERIR